jgi:hypothetical protein
MTLVGEFAGADNNASAALEIMREWEWRRCDPDGFPFHPGKDLNWIINRLAMEGLRKPQAAVLTLLSQGELLARGNYRWRKYQDLDTFQSDVECDAIKTRHWQNLARSIEETRGASGWDSATGATLQLCELGLKDCLAHECEDGSCRFSYAVVTAKLAPFDDDYMEEWYSAWDIDVWPPALDCEHVNSETEPAVPSANRGGAPRKWDWDGALLHLAALAHHGVNGLFRDDGSDPNQSDIARHLRAWFIDTCDNSPENSQLRDYGKRFVIELNALKLGDANNPKAAG